MKLVNVWAKLWGGVTSKRKAQARNRLGLGSVEQLEDRRVLARATVGMFSLQGESVFEGSEVAVAGWISKGPVIGFIFSPVPGTQPRLVNAHVEVLIKGKTVDVAFDELPGDDMRFTVTRQAIGGRNFRAMKKTGAIVVATVQGSTPGEMVGYGLSGVGVKQGTELDVMERPAAIYTVVNPA